MLDHTAGEHLGRVVAGGTLPVAPRQAEHEAALGVTHPHGTAGVGVLGGDEHVVGVAVGVVDGQHPRATLGVAALGHLEQVTGGEEPAIGHQPLVHRTQLVDAQLGIGDEPGRVAFAFAGGQHQLAEHLLEGLVAQGDAVEQLG